MIPRACLSFARLTVCEFLTREWGQTQVWYGITFVKYALHM